VKGLGAVEKLHAFRKADIYQYVNSSHLPKCSAKCSAELPISWIDRFQPIQTSSVSRLRNSNASCPNFRSIDARLSKLIRNETDLGRRSGREPLLSILETDRSLPSMHTFVRMLLVVFVVFGLSGCTEEWTWHQKVTVSVLTPQGIKTASSVTSARFRNKGKWFAPPEARRAVLSVSGEALMLEMEPGRYLFAPLTSTPAAYEVFFPGAAPVDVIGKFDGLRQTRELSREQYPLLVTFADVKDPASVRRVDPADLGATFGPGYRLNSITMTITDEPVTKGKVEEVLGWLSSFPERKLSPATGRTTDIPFSRRMSHGDFVRR
jgi:hypothetical protein